MANAKERLAVLRRHEELCYSICLYLVRCDKLACEAAADALFNLAHCDSFFQAEETERLRQLRDEAARCALRAISRRTGHTPAARLPIERHPGT